MAIRSLISQGRQVQSSDTYKDLNYIDGGQGERELKGNVHDALYAESVQYLEEDLNNLRSQIRDIIGKGTWYAEASTSLEMLQNRASIIEGKLNEHNKMLHHLRNEDTVFGYVDGILTEIVTYKVDTDDILQEVLFTFDLNDNLSKVVKTVWDENLVQYIKTEKNLLFDIAGTLEEIQTRII